jgi:hypothetical protein
MRLILIFLAGVLLGHLSWGASYLLTGTFEPFDNSTGFFVCEAVLAVPAFVIGLRAGVLRALLCLLGAWVGMNAYAYAFGSSETRAWIVLLLFSSLTLLAFPAVAGVIGGIARAILRKSRLTATPAA